MYSLPATCRRDLIILIGSTVTAAKRVINIRCTGPALVNMDGTPQVFIQCARRSSRRGRPSPTAFQPRGCTGTTASTRAWTQCLTYNHVQVFRVVCFYFFKLLMEFLFKSCVEFLLDNESYIKSISLQGIY